MYIRPNLLLIFSDNITILNRAKYFFPIKHSNGLIALIIIIIL